MNKYPKPRFILVQEERSLPDPAQQVQFQPFLRYGDFTLDSLQQCLSLPHTTRETIALALSQITAQRILPALTTIETGSQMLNYQVRLRDVLSPMLTHELGLVLASHGRELGWEQVSQYQFLCVIGAGVAASLDVTPGQEQLDLRYASDLQDRLYLAGSAPDRLRSRLFLQTALFEKVDNLLSRLRERIWYWL